jgi:hypothetical protein
MNGEEWLSTVFEPALAGDRLHDSYEGYVLRRQLDALRDCAVLPGPVVERAQRRLDDLADAERARRRRGIRPAGTAGAEPVQRLRTVLAPAAPLVDVDAMTFLLTTVEVWSNRVDLVVVGIPTADSDRQIREHEADVDRWFRAGHVGEPPRAGYERLFPTIDVRVSDDAGTEYRFHTGSGGGTGTEYRLHRTYEPGPPDGATRLVVAVVDGGQPVGRVDLLL